MSHGGCSRTVSRTFRAHPIFPCRNDLLLLRTSDFLQGPWGIAVEYSPIRLVPSFSGATASQVHWRSTGAAREAQKVPEVVRAPGCRVVLHSSRTPKAVSASGNSTSSSAKKRRPWHFPETNPWSYKLLQNTPQTQHVEPGACNRLRVSTLRIALPVVHQVRARRRMAGKK